MTKLPVFDTIVCAYHFLFREWRTILRLSWLPLLIVAVLQYLATAAAYRAMREAVNDGKFTDIKSISEINKISGGWFLETITPLAYVIGTAIVAVALHRVVLYGDRRPGQYFYLAFGKAEFLFAVLPIVFILLFFGAAVTGIAPALLATGSSDVPTIGYVAGGLMLVAVGLFVFVAVRLSLIFPVIVAEGRFDLASAWNLSRDNFWRLIGVGLGALIPATFVIGMVGWFLVGFYTLPVIQTMRSGDVAGAIRTMIEANEASLPMLTFLNYVASVVTGALGVGILSYSYKALSGRAPDDLLPQVGGGATPS